MFKRKRKNRSFEEMVEVAKSNQDRREQMHEERVDRAFRNLVQRFSEGKYRMVESASYGDRYYVRINPRMDQKEREMLKQRFNQFSTDPICVDVSDADVFGRYSDVVLKFRKDLHITYKIPMDSAGDVDWNAKIE